ncbi:exotoxin [Pseudomonas fragi]|uniref:fimbrial protein n=1 Tax=Pseudomonas fragi TaxID=296 RepID=UPI000BA2A890|nr:fimbrial protein [Pseudomonas fragi]PAA31549.1 exotoxin [Pseudomonas fragi]
MHIGTKTGYGYALALLMGMPMLLPGTLEAADNLSFRGVLVADACTLRPGDEAVQWDLRDVSIKYLYLYSRTLGMPFQLHLEGCDTTVGSSVTVTFSGNESLVLPGLLALDGGSRASGVAIGIETPADRPLPLNTASDEQALSNGNNTITLKAYIRGEPQAIASQSITAGTFRATSTFTLHYP